jgi:lactoylglutathione lyase
LNLTLLVIRSAIPESSAEFYSLFGLTFEYRRHGNSPYHSSARVGPALLEVYPLAKTQEKADTTLRLGFSIAEFERMMHELSRRGVTIHQEATQTEWGLMSIIADPEGRKIELYKEEC